MKDYILNPSNGRNLAAMFGDDMDDWEGKQVRVTTHETSMGPGVLLVPISVDALERPTKSPPKTSAAIKAQAPLKKGALDELDDDITF